MHGKPEVDSVRRRIEVPARELFDSPEAVAEGVRVDVEQLGGRPPASSRSEKCRQCGNEFAAVILVPRFDGAEDAQTEGLDETAIEEVQQELVRADCKVANDAVS